jgi:hypothetical protein
MQRRTRVKPGKASSVLGIMMGIAFILLGIFFVLPTSSSAGFGFFGIIWLVMAAAMVITSAINLFSEQGTAIYEIETNVSAQTAANDFDTRLRKLAQLHKDGLLSDAEYEQKRNEVMSERW